LQIEYILVSQEEKRTTQKEHTEYWSTKQVTTKAETAHQTAGLIYCLWLLGILFGITALIGVFINHTKLETSRNTYAYSHFIWQRIAFGAVLAGIVISVVLWPQPLGQVFAFATFFIWLFGAMIGSWYLSKSRRIKFLDRQLSKSDSEADDHYHRREYHHDIGEDQPKEIVGNT